jgi:hypothetical protein
MLWWLHVNNAIIYAGECVARLNSLKKVLLMPFGICCGEAGCAVMQGTANFDHYFK